MADPALKEKPEAPETGASAPAGRTAYERDYYTWALEQVALIRARRFDEIDAEHVAEELESSGKSEFHKLRSTLRVLVMHMLKWDQQPEHRTATWIYAIREQRRRYRDILGDNPGLRSRRDEALRRCYPDARDWASDETHLQPGEFPKACPYTWDDLLDRPFDFDSVKK